MIKLKRVYEAPEAADGQRILVERLWPRGLTKDRARVDWWPKEVAPTPSLRRWYGHDAAKWAEFRRRYLAELADNGELVEQLVTAARSGDVTFVFASRELERNSAAVLKAHVETLP